MRSENDKPVTMPLVSIVIPCYNAERYVGEAVQSALSQTYPNVEVIVIDDGSTDGSLDVIRSFGDAIRWETGPNRGGSAARNRGVAIARGELIQFLDADDLLYPHKLERQAPLVVDKVADVVYCDTDLLDKDYPGQAIRQSFIYRGGDPVIFTLGESVQTATPIHWKELLVSVGGFREDLPCAQDHDLSIRLGCAGASFYRLPEALYAARKTANSVSSDLVRVLDQHKRIYWDAYNGLQRAGQLTEARAAAFAARMTRDAGLYLRCGATAKAREYFQSARSMHAGAGLRDNYHRLGCVLCPVVGFVLTHRIIASARAFRRWLHRPHEG